MQGGSGDEESSSMMPAVASGAAVGALFGLLLDRRGRKAGKAAAAVPVAFALAKQVGDIALDAVEHAAEAARPLVEQAAEAALPLIEGARERIAA